MAQAPSWTAGVSPASGGSADSVLPARTPAVQDVRAILANVPDPEIPAVSVIDLGIVREISADRVVITPTYTGCPATLAIEQSIRAALDANGFANVAIETTLSPPWSTDWISDKGREDLRAYGIAPPPKGAAAASLKNQTAAECPRCGSSNTEELSRFGSTPCKALWRCKACAEPFDRFKCH
ncbi:MAG: phenylacetate-CoA oxygenase subunit PaaJ [Hyphomonadaceae bacterium]|nr:phenylacetate-CoA oxygenase subunit PaaJ [Hyphomonadaceae bacterium]